MCVNIFTILWILHINVNSFPLTPCFIKTLKKSLQKNKHSYFESYQKNAHCEPKALMNIRFQRSPLWVKAGSQPLFTAASKTTINPLNTPQGPNLISPNASRLHARTSLEISLTYHHFYSPSFPCNKKGKLIGNTAPEYALDDFTLDSRPWRHRSPVSPFALSSC